MAKQKTFSAKISEETADLIQDAFERSGTYTKDEFLRKILNNEKKTPEIEPLIIEEEPESLQIAPEPQVIAPRTIEVERKPEPNEIVISLNPEQLFALRETVLGSEDFATEQNKVIDSIYNNERPFLYTGNLFNPEFHDMWVKSKEITEDMTEDQKESVIKHNMTAFLLNFFNIHLIEGDVTESKVNYKKLKTFIQENIKAKQVPINKSNKSVQLIPDSQDGIIKTIEVDRKLAPNEILISLNSEQLYVLRETVLGSEDFAAEQNRLIDSIYKNEKPFLYFGNLFNPEFHDMWVKSQEITKDMTEDQRESAIKHNMAAFLLNFFNIHLIEGDVSESVVNAKNLKAYIQEKKVVKPDVN
jgi:hypothetical protein